MPSEEFDRSWEDYYRQTKPEDLPWNAGGADPDLVRLVSAGRIPVGRALDIGTGPGHDAVFLIQRGFSVIGLDISPAAVALARENAGRAGVAGVFEQGDIRRIAVEDGAVDFINDRGCFHVLLVEDRGQAVSELRRVLRAGGILLLRVVSDKEAPRDEPHRFARKELEDLFQESFRILEFWEGVYKGPLGLKTYSLLMEKK